MSYIQRLLGFDISTIDDKVLLFKCTCHLCDHVAAMASQSPCHVFMPACPGGVPGWITGGGGSCYHESLLSKSWYDSQKVRQRTGYMPQI